MRASCQYWALKFQAGLTAGQNEIIQLGRRGQRDSSTEGDTLQLTATRMREDKRDYVTRLVQIWQRAVYGGQQPETGSLYGLCDEFAPALDSV